MDQIIVVLLVISLVGLATGLVAIRRAMHLVVSGRQGAAALHRDRRRMVGR